MSSEARLNNYVGSDRSGWGYLANKAIWHNKSKVRIWCVSIAHKKCFCLTRGGLPIVLEHSYPLTRQVRSYGDLFREGDTIGVSLNMDLGTLRFSRNGRDLGLAVQGLEGTLYPSFSMYNRCGRSAAVSCVGRPRGFDPKQGRFDPSQALPRCSRTCEIVDTFQVRGYK